MKTSICLSLILCVLFVMTGCASTYSGVVKNASDLIMIARVMANLSSLNEADNIAGFNELGARYDIDLTTPFQTWFTASADLTQALRELRKAIQNDTSREITPEMDELLHVLETLESTQ